MRRRSKGGGREGGTAGGEEAVAASVELRQTEVRSGLQVGQHPGAFYTEMDFFESAHFQNQEKKKNMYTEL